MADQLALMGGTFNPVHVGHLRLGLEAIERLGADRLVLMPCASPPHKRPRDLADAEHRLAMCRLAARQDRRVEVTDIELRRQGPSYTVDTLRQWHAERPGNALVLLIGADMLRDLAKWREVEQVVRLARVVTLPRPDAPLGRLPALRDRIGDEATDRILGDVLSSLGQVDVSSTEIRSRLARGQPVTGMVPPAVEQYIAEHGLYR